MIGRSLTRRASGLAGLLCTIVAATATGQRAIALWRLEPGTCARCAVAIDLIATVGKADDPELIDEYGQLFALPDGGFVVSSGRGQAPLMRYDRTGRYVGKLGKVGDGPGEYRRALDVRRARGDSISILGDGRITTISLATGAGRSTTFAPNLRSFRHVSLPDGSSLVNPYELKQSAFVLLSRDGAVIRQFGPTQPPLVLPHQNGRTITDAYATDFVLAPSSSGGVWVAATNYQHHVMHLALDGTVLHDLARHPAWFAPYTYADIDEKAYRLGELRTPPPTRTLGIGVDSAGFVLVVSRVADAHWVKDPKAPPPHEPGLEYPVEKLTPTGGIDRYVDGVLEVYDDRTGAFLGSWRSDAALGTLAPNGLLIKRGEDADGVISFQVYRVRVTH